MGRSDQNSSRRKDTDRSVVVLSHHALHPASFGDVSQRVLSSDGFSFLVEIQEETDPLGRWEVSEK